MTPAPIKWKVFMKLSNPCKKCLTYNQCKDRLSLRIDYDYNVMRSIVKISPDRMMMYIFIKESKKILACPQIERIPSWRLKQIFKLKVPRY